MSRSSIGAVGAARYGQRTRSPARIYGEHRGPHQRALQSRGLDQPLDLFKHRSEEIALLEERVCRLDRSREEIDAPCVLRDPLPRGDNGGRRGGPHQEHGIDAIETSMQGLGNSEIPANHRDLG
jgi:hypothetical protein